MSTQDSKLWLEYDLNMLKFVVELQISNHGTFPLEQLMDKVGLLDRGDSYPGLTPWDVTEACDDSLKINLSYSLMILCWTRMKTSMTTISKSLSAGCKIRIARGASVKSKEK